MRLAFAANATRLMFLAPAACSCGCGGGRANLETRRSGGTVGKRSCRALLHDSCAELVPIGRAP
jgi:hypothetical protein